MEHITVANIEKEIKKLLDHAPLTCENLDKFVLMCKAMKHLSGMHYEFTEEDARAWAKKMNPPARWTMDQTTIVLRQKGYDHKPCEFYAVMNSLFSDYGKTVAKHGLDKPDFWAEMAHDWLDDLDAEEGKVGRYFRDIVRH